MKHASPLFPRLRSVAPVLALTLGLAVPPLSAPAAAEADPAALAEEAKGVMMAFGKQLKGELQAAMKAGGPVNAISVCNDKARPIAQQVGAAHGWSVGRASHKVRSPANRPDVYEEAVIDTFLARQKAGEAAANMVHAEIVESASGKAFRFIKAIPTEEICLTCHGTAIKPEVAAKLDELYPMDQARGFSAGDMRGVFTLKKDL